MKWPWQRRAPASAPEKPRRSSRPVMVRFPGLGGGGHSLRDWTAGVYHGADSNRLTGSWTRTPLSIDEITLRNLRPLRARSREECRQNPHARRFVTLCQRHAIGPRGIRLQGRVLDLAGARDRERNRALETAWQAWGRECDASGRLTWRRLQHVALRAIAEDGEVFLRLVRGAGPFGLRVQLLDPELVDVEHNAELPDGGFIRFGIEFGADGEPRAYHVRKSRAGVPVSLYARETTRVDARDVVHVYLEESVGQKRGLPWLSTALWDLHALGAYKEAAVMNARAGASKTGFYQVDPELAEEDYQADEEDADGAFLEDIEPLTARKLPAGWTWSAFTPEYPNGEFPMFVKSGLRTIAAGLGVSYHSLAEDLEGVNFSSIRAGTLEERDGWEVAQEWFAEAFLAPVFSEWLPMALLSGAIRAVLPDGSLGAAYGPEDQERFSRVLWQPRRWDWVDPLKDASAIKLEVDAGVESLSGWARRRGRDLEEVLEERAADEALLARFGLSGGNAAAGAGGSATDDDDDAESEEDDRLAALIIARARNGRPK